MKHITNNIIVTVIIKNDINNPTNIYIHIFCVCLWLLLGLCRIAGFSLAEASWGYPTVAVLRLLIAVASLMGPRHVGFSSCSALGSRVQTQ